jgi:SAM-dependent methyltransferase
MENELIAKLNAFYGADPAPQMRKHLEFALTNRRRGKKALDRVVAKTGIELRGKRVLDVGSAYGGFVIEAAARGAEAWGIEISGRLHEYGLLNAKGESGDIHQVHADFCSRKALRELPRDFDLVLINDVFEHVYDTAALLDQLRTVMRDGAPFVFSIPNGDALSAVEREGHNGTPGISQLAPNWWHYYIPSYTAFYRPWSHYTALFRGFGFDRIDAWRRTQLEPADARIAIAQGLERALAAVASLDPDTKGRQAMAAAIEEYQERLAADLETAPTTLLQWRYLTNFWEGCAYKGGPLLAEVDGRDGDVDRPSNRRPSARDRFEQIVPGAVGRLKRTIGKLVGPKSSPEAAPRAGMETVSLDRTPAELASRWCKRATTEITVTGGAIRCEVTGDAHATGDGQYGGVRLPVANPGRLHLELELFGTEHIEGVFVDGEDGGGHGHRRMRWWWRDPRPEAAVRATHELVAGSDGPKFRAISPAVPAEVTEIHVFLHVARGQRAGFVLHRVEVGD